MKTNAQRLAAEYAAAKEPETPELAALWDAVEQTCEAFRPVDLDVLRLARSGHRNRTAIVAGCVPDLVGCSCGEDVRCNGCEPTAGEAAYYDALVKLLSACAGGRWVTATAREH
jgi:hypothetical protein